MWETARLSLLGFSQALLGPVYDGVGRVLCGGWVLVLYGFSTSLLALTLNF
jgi:hypothetical protein